MKKRVLAILLAAAMLLCACGAEESVSRGKRRKAAKSGVSISITPTGQPDPTGEPTPTEVPEPTVEPIPTEVPATPTPTEIPMPTDTPIPTLSPEERIDVGAYGFTIEQVLEYYLEVGMTSEYNSGAPIDYVRKWDRVILVRIEGTPDEDDMELVNRLFDALNDVEGFPGIIEYDGDDPTMVIRFLDYDEYQSYALEHVNNEASDGYSSIWFSDGVITRAEIGIRNELTRTNKNHVVLEEIVQSLGLQNDSYAYPDSLFYQAFNQPQWPSDLDWLLVRFLYRPELMPLMKAPEVIIVGYEVLKE